MSNPYNTTDTRTAEALPATVQVHLGDSFACTQRGNWSAGLRATNSTANGLGVRVAVSRHEFAIVDGEEEITTANVQECERVLAVSEARMLAEAILHACHVAEMIERDRAAAAYRASEDARFGHDDFYRADCARRDASIAERSEQMRQPID